MTTKFNPEPIRVPNECLDATIVTCHPPHVNRNAFVVGICAVPKGRAGKNDLGYHVADFLAYKSLLTTRLTNRAQQEWLSQTDPADADDKHGYSHSGRLVGRAARDASHPITVETNAHALVGKFMKALTQKATDAQEHNDPLVVIACGLSSLEQAIFVVEGDNYVAAVTSESIRAAIGETIEVTFVTPSVTSAGWQVNPSLMRPVATRADPIEFMSRQCGGIFGHNIIQRAFIQGSPFYQRDHDDFPDLVVKGPELEEAEAKLQTEIHVQLAGRFVSHPFDHSFCFDPKSDSWNLIGLRHGIPLEKLSERWRKLPQTTKSTDSINDGFYFLGEAFGGNRESQLVHLKHMFMQTMNYPGYHSSNLGKDLRKEFNDLMRAANQDEIDCHVLFSGLEHRVSFMTLADLVTRSFGLPSSFNTRCRDWDEANLAEDHDPAATRKIWREILPCFPAISVPYRRNINPYVGFFNHLSGPTRFIAAVLALRCTRSGNGCDEAIDTVRRLLRQIEAHQLKLLCAHPRIGRLSAIWSDLVHEADTMKKRKGSEASETTAEGNSAIEANAMARNIISGNISHTPLSALAESFVPGTIFKEPSIPQVVTEPTSHATETTVASSTSTKEALVQSLCENLEPDDSASELELVNQCVCVNQSTITDDSSASKTNPVLPSPRTNSTVHIGMDVDEEQHLPPHLRKRLRGPTIPAATLAETASVTPISQAASSADTTQDEPMSSLGEPQSELCNIPPHLRSVSTLGLTSLIKYR